MTSVLPPRLYRTHHDLAFTPHDAAGFQSRGTYFMDYSHWLNRGKIIKHLKWQDRSEQPTPFISLTDDPSKSTPHRTWTHSLIKCRPCSTASSITHPAGDAWSLHRHGGQQQSPARTSSYPILGGRGRPPHLGRRSRGTNLFHARCCPATPHPLPAGTSIGMARH